MNNSDKKQKIEQLKKGLKIAGKATLKLSGKIGKKVLRITAKTIVWSAKNGYKGAKKTYNEYKKLSKEAKRDLHSGLLVAGGILGLSGTFYMSRHVPEKVPEKVQVTDTRADSIHSALTKTYKITDEASFKELYEASLPLIHASMLPTEIYKQSAYDDRGGANPNSIAVGLFWFPKDGNPQSSEWILASKYFKMHPELKVSYEKAIKFTDGWYRYREDGRVYKQMFKRLQGAEINIHQFVACATCTYNNELSGFAFCDYVKEHYKEPVKCAHFLLTLDPKDPNCIDGILKRHTSEACMFMYPEYAMQVYSFKMKNITYTNKKGETKHHTITSVNQINPDNCKKVKADLARGDTRSLEGVRNKICKYICKNGETIEEFIRRNVENTDVLKSLLCYNDNNDNVISTVDFSEKRAEITYKDALAKYEAHDYEAALAGFQQLRANGYDGADLRCDIAITHYHLGHYEECIAECRAVLETGEEQLYPRATYNAGKAYEALGNYERAHKNYERSLIVAQKNNMADSMQNIYKNAMHRMDSIMNSLNPQKKSIMPSQQNISKNNGVKNKPTQVSSKPKGNVNNKVNSPKIRQGNKRGR